MDITNNNNCIYVDAEYIQVLIKKKSFQKSFTIFLKALFFIALSYSEISEGLVSQNPYLLPLQDE